MQKGNIKLRGNCWMLRYYEPVLENGRVVKRARAKKLATYSLKQYRYEEDVRPLADLILAPINARTAPVESRQDIAAFLEHVYLPHVKESKRPATYSAYLGMWRMVKAHLNGLQLRAARTSDIDDLMKAATGDKKRAHTTHRNLRNFLSGAFRFAIRRNMAASNPVRDAEIPRGLPSAKKARYTLGEIQAMIAALPEPSRTIVTVAGLTGLRLSEIKGLKWEDFRGDELDVQRSVWSGYVSDTKTLTSKAAVPVLPIVRKALDAHKKRTPDAGYIFAGSTGQPLRLENVLRRDMRPVLDKKNIPWKGWHAFRRGLGTNLNALGSGPENHSGYSAAQPAIDHDGHLRPACGEGIPCGDEETGAGLQQIEKTGTPAQNNFVVCAPYRAKLFLLPLRQDESLQPALRKRKPAAIRKGCRNKAVSHRASGLLASDS